MSENKRLYLVTGAAGILVKHQIYEMAEYEEDKFFKHLYRESKLPRDDYNRSGMAYVMSKNFTVWYAQKERVEVSIGSRLRPCKQSGTGM